MIVRDATLQLGECTCEPKLTDAGREVVPLAFIYLIAAAQGGGQMPGAQGEGKVAVVTFSKNSREIMCMLSKLETGNHAYHQVRASHQHR